MLKGKIILNKELLNKKYIQESLNEDLKKAKANLDTIMTQENNLFESYKEDELLKIINILRDASVLEDIEISGYEDVKFEYENVNKKTLLLILSIKWRDTFTVERAIHNMVGLQYYEENFGKCVRSFNNYEIKETVLSLHEKYKYYGMRIRVHLLSMYQEIFKEKSEKSKNNKNIFSWRAASKPSELRNILSDSNIKEDIVTKKALLLLSEQMENVQESVIPLLIFEGVKLSDDDQVDELRSLKKENLIGDKLIIRGGKERVIDISKEVADLVRAAIDADHIVAEVFGVIREYEIQDSEYIIRRSITKSYASLSEGIVKYRGIYARIKKCREVFESFAYNTPFTPKQIELFGKIHYVNKYVNEGYEVSDALRMTLQRFGEWKIEDGKDGGIQSRQLTHRLKTQWLIYK